MKKLSFDGKGINNKSKEYTPRVATFQRVGDAREFGSLFESAPEMLEALKIISAVLNDHVTDNYPWQVETMESRLNLINRSIAKAEGQDNG